MGIAKRKLLLLALLPALLGGCGDSRTALFDLSIPAPPHGFKVLRYPAAGISFVAPRTWFVQRQQAPLVTVVTSGQAVVSVWRFPRPKPAPAGQAALTQATAALVAAAHKRDATLQLIRSRLTTLAGARAIEIDAYEHVGSQIRRVRSTHVFVFGSEIVLEQYAPPNLFHAVDHAVFSPLKRSLRLAPSQA